MSDTKKKEEAREVGSPVEGIVRLVPYIVTYEHMGIISRKPLKPTGRWKIESGPYYKNRMFVEHQGFIFKRWISENSICFRAEKKIEIFTCSS